MGKILLTGAAGFIGSHLCELLIKQGYDVKAFDRYNISGSYGWMDKSEHKKDVEFVLGDLRDYDSVYKALKGCSAVFHLGALIGIPYSYLSPLAYIRTNIEGSYNVLEAAKELELDQILITSTSETYGSAQYVPINEKHPLVGQSPYSASKIAADQLAISYIKSFQQPIKIVRPFNTYGPRQSSRAIIPTIISQLKNNVKKIKLGNLEPTRDLTYVSDTAESFIEIYKNEYFFGDVVNVGSGNETSVRDLFDLISKEMNKQAKIDVDSERVRPEASEVDRLVCDNSKLLSHSSWTPNTQLKEGIKKTIDWFMNKNVISDTDQYHV